MEGVTDPTLELPEGVALVDGPRGLRLRGYEHAVSAALQMLRSLRDQPEGYGVTLGAWTLRVSDYAPAEPEPQVVTMPGHAWNIAASVLGGAAYGEYDENPFDFSQVGYLDPPPHPDIGIEIVFDPSWAFGGTYFAQCPACLLQSPALPSQEDAGEWQRTHDAESHRDHGSAGV
jgi:hypothetical protein